MRVKIKQIERRIEAQRRFRERGTEIDERVHLMSADEDRQHLVSVVKESSRRIENALNCLKNGNNENAKQILENLLSELTEQQ